MPKFLALTSKGLLPTLEEELNEQGFSHAKRSGEGLLFETNWRGCYKANLNLRTSTRIIMPILDFNAYNGEELYHNVQKHDFTKYIDVNGGIEVIATTQSRVFHSQQYVMLKVKDAIVDQFRNKYDARPNVSKDKPDLRIYVRVKDTEVSLSIDTSGKSLSLRGYRTEAGKAPLREHLAAGLLRMTGWKPEQNLLDPMCGSGTFLIEGALMARSVAPGMSRQGFAFQRLKGFQTDAWDETVAEALDKEIEECPAGIYGYDVSGRAIDVSKANAERADVEDNVEFRKCPVVRLEAPAENGIIIVNPPYAERIGRDVEEVKDTYRDFGFALKKSFKAWTCWLLSGNSEITAALGLKATQRIPVYNGNIDCRFLKYEIR